MSNDKQAGAAVTTRGGIDANELEAMAKEMPDECFLKGSGVLKLIAAIRQLEQAALARAPLPAEGGAQEPKPVAWMDPTAGCVMDAFLWQRDPTNPQYCVPVYEAPAQADEARDAAQRVERRIQSIWEDANTDWGDAVGGPPAHEIFAHRLISAMQDEIAASLAGKDKHAEG